MKHQSPRSLKLPLPGILIPGMLYFISLSVAFTLGFNEFEIPWNYWQLLDQKALMEDPLHSLYLLHSQPPMLNALLAVLLKCGEVLGGSPAFWAQSLFYGIGFLSTVLLYKITRLLTESHIWSTFSIVLFLFNPATWLFSHLYFYPYLVSFFLLTLLFLQIKYVKAAQEKEHLPLFAAALTIALICNLRSLYHPLWGVGIFLTILLTKSLLVRRKKPLSNRRSWLVAGCFLVLIFAWPLKNYLLFGQFNHTTWTGFNLSKRTPVSSPAIKNYWYQGDVPGHVQERLTTFKTKHGLEDIRVLEQIEKTNGGRNWNHYLFVIYNPELTRKAVQYRLKNPKWWIKTALSHYFRWTQPSFVTPYHRNIRGTDHPLYQSYASLLQSALFHDLRPALKKIHPEINITMKTLFIEESNEKLGVSFFGLILFPLLMAGSISLILKKFLQGEYRDAAIYLPPFLTVIWVLVVPCLSDGYEGNRMRYGVYPYLVLFSLLILNTMLDTFSHETK